MWGTFFKNFTKTVQNTKNQSIRIVFQYKFTIRPVTFWLLNSQKYSKISQKVRGLNNDLRCPLAHCLDKTKNLCSKHNFFAVISRISAVETVEYSLVVPLSIYHFEKVRFPSENVKIGD